MHLQDLNDQLMRHRSEATAAMELYKERATPQRVDYLTLCAASVEALLGDPTSTTEKRKRLYELASKFYFLLSSDYQQDKSTPFWGLSPQPGPTYFFSKETAYVHIINAHALGEAAGPTRLAYNHFYIRSQQCAGSKDCNDTVFTIFDMLAAPLIPVCPLPPVYRTGYDAQGAILGSDGQAAAEGTAEDTTSTAACDSDSSDRIAYLVSRLQCSTCTPAEAQKTADIILKAADAVASQPRDSDAPITVLEILKATCGDAATLHSSLGGSTGGVAPETLVHAALAYLLSSKPQQFVRCIDHQMDRCGGTNISQYTFGGFALSLAVSAADVWRANTMVPGHTKFAPDKTALNLANKCAPHLHNLAFAQPIA